MLMLSCFPFRGSTAGWFAVLLGRISGILQAGTASGELRRLLPAFAILLAAAVSICPTRAGEKQLVLHEHVGREWQDELLHYPFSAAERACDPSSLRATGPEGPIAVQLHDIQFWPGSQTVREARLSLVVDLAAWATDRYTLHYGPEPVVEEPPSELEVRLDTDSVALTNRRFGARLRLGAQTYDPPRAAAEVPGPLLEFRRAAGDWFGGSRLFGQTRITAWSAELVAVGPVFAQVDTVYHYEDGNVVRWSAVLHERASGLMWYSDVAEDRPDDGIDLLLCSGLPPLTLVIQREAYADRPEGWNYLVLRDTVRGGEPSLWQMWTVSNGLYSPQQAAAVRSGELAGWGNQPVPAHPVDGDRLTAVGQFDVDVEYFVASSRDTPQWTMRWGQAYRDYSVQGHDYRDLLQLRLDGEGHYLVAMFPRFSDQTAPEFALLGDGTVIRIQADAGTDYVFLPGEEAEVTLGNADFRGLGGSIQDRQSGLVLAIAAAGHVGYGEWGLTASQAASLRVAGCRSPQTIRKPLGCKCVRRVIGSWTNTHLARS